MEQNDTYRASVGICEESPVWVDLVDAFGFVTPRHDNSCLLGTVVPSLDLWLGNRAWPVGLQRRSFTEDCSQQLGGAYWYRYCVGRRSFKASTNRNAEFALSR